ncbi:MAG: hypothetical protein IJS46_01395 [Kiritimatiellae bacterium]|nr:hypothetical protein [Kiritimatiellia bacterium]
MGEEAKTTAEATSFESEKLALEREKLALERERLEAQSARIEELEAQLDAVHRRSFSVEPAVAAVAAAVVVAIGGIVGAAIGFDIGKKHASVPRKVLLSRSFISAMRSVSGVRLSAFDQEVHPAPWMPQKRTDFPEELVLVR